MTNNTFMIMNKDFCFIVFTFSSLMDRTVGEERLTNAFSNFF